MLITLVAGCGSQTSELQQAMKQAFYANQQLSTHLGSGNFLGIQDQARVMEDAVPILRSHNPEDQFQNYVSDYASALDILIESAQAENADGAQAAAASLRAACAQCHRVYRTE